MAVFRRNRELWFSLAAILVMTGLYLLAYGLAGRLPAASNLIGHGVGILGFVFMLMTQTLYTLRKRARSPRWGKVSSWLSFHIFTGLVGSYMVLLHPAMRFHGMAAVLALLTGVVVASGAVGRYIYTLIPREVDAEMVVAGETGQQMPLPAARGALALWRTIHIPLTFTLFALAFVHVGGAIYYATLLH